MSTHSEYSAEDVVALIGEQGKRNGNLVKIHCYNTSFHTNGDKNPSLAVYDGDKGYYCYACGENGSHSWLLKQYGIEDRSYSRERKSYTTQVQKKSPANNSPKPKDFTTYPLSEIHASLQALTPEAVEVFDAKGLRWQDLERVLGYRWYSGNAIPSWSSGVFIPYYYQGEMVSARLRRLDGNPRFQGLTGGESYPYLLDSVHAGHSFVCEGESDTATLALLGFDVVGVPGAQGKAIIEKVLSTAADTGCRLTVIADSDTAGQSMLETFRAGAFEHRIPIDSFTVPGYKDVNEWYVAVGGEAVERALHNYQERSIFAEIPPLLTQRSLAV